ncbi:MAG: cell division protein ZapA [Gemmatimonadaceae bacterium]|nr:cell division protein ZapA [Gemmatimonadaceae bacterium]
MSTKRSVRVSIVGEEYPIRTERSAEFTRAVADYVDRTIRSVLESGTVIETHKAAILAAMKITDELFHAREEGEALAGDMRALAAEIRRLLPPAKRETA